MHRVLQPCPPAVREVGRVISVYSHRVPAIPVLISHNLHPIALLGETACFWWNSGSYWAPKGKDEIWERRRHGGFSPLVISCASQVALLVAFLGSFDHSMLFQHMHSLILLLVKSPAKLSSLLLTLVVTTTQMGTQLPESSSGPLSLSRGKRLHLKIGRLISFWWGDYTSIMHIFTNYFCVFQRFVSILHLKKENIYFGIILEWHEQSLVKKPQCPPMSPDHHQHQRPCRRIWTSSELKC